jgi:predicted site-specific integrase-resolvase
MSEDSKKEYISIREASKLTGICPQTLRKMSDQKQLKTYKTLSGQRKFEKQYLEEFCSSSSLSKNRHKKNYIYARIVADDNVEDLNKQIQFIRNIDPIYETYTVITDISPGTNFKRKGLSTLLDSCLEKNIGEIVVTHKDKLSRIGYDLINQIVHKAGGSIIILEDEKYKPSDHEISDDLFTIAKAYCKKS